MVMQLLEAPMKPEEIAKIKREAEERLEQLPGETISNDQRTILALCAEVERLRDTSTTTKSCSTNATMQDKYYEWYVLVNRCALPTRICDTQEDAWSIMEPNDNEYRVIEYAAFEKAVVALNHPWLLDALDSCMCGYFEGDTEETGMSECARCAVIRTRAELGLAEEEK